MSVMPGAHVSVQRMRPMTEAGEISAGPARRRFGGSRVAASLAPLSPRGVGQILDDAFDVLIARFGTCVVIGTILMLPVQLGMELFHQAPLEETIYLFSPWFWTFLAFPVQFFAAACVCRIVGSHLQGEEVQIGEVVNEITRRLVGIAFLSILIGVIVGVGTVCCYLPGVVFQWLFSVVLACYLLEGLSVGEALGRSVRLTSGWGSLGRWLGYFTVSSIIAIPLSSPSSLLMNPDVRGVLEEYLPLDGGPMGFLLAALSAFFMGIALAYPAILMVVYYTDLRVRKEGMDLDRELDRLIERSGGGVA
jgi:hypothetical protein